MGDETSAPNGNDHAIVVGIANYPGLMNDEGQPSDLDGPVIDATAVRDWLVAPDGGGLAARNVALITTTKRVRRAGSAKPTALMVQKAFRDLSKRTSNDPGRRLYLYFSGHGFAPGPDQGSLFTAECESDVDMPNIWASEYLAWFRAKKRFDEYVLWMDCCADQDLILAPQSITFPRSTSVGDAGPRLIGIAAQTGMRAVETAMQDDGGRVHGVFTWTLLSGLRKAVNAEHHVTGESLRDYLLNTMKDFLPAEAKEGREISLRPFVLAEPGLVFGPKRAPKATLVTLTAPRTSAGAEVNIWTGSPPRIAVKVKMTAGGFETSLENGIYVAEVAGKGLRDGFEVTGSESLDGRPFTVGIATKHGEAARRTSKLCRLTVQTGTEAASIHLIGSDFRRRSESFGFFDANCEPGIYKLRVQYGRELVDVSEKIILLDGPQVVEIEPPRLKSPIPIEGTAFTHEFHVAAAQVMETRQGATAQFGILARFWTGERPVVTDASRYPHPLQGLSLCDQDDRTIVDETKFEAVSAQHAHGGGDPIATFAIDVEPGNYFLRQRLASGRILERTLVACTGWRTDVFVQRDVRDIAGEAAAGSPQLSRTGALGLLMSAVNPERQTAKLRAAADDARRQDQLTIEATRVALAQGRHLFRDSPDHQLTQQLLQGKFVDPILGIVGAHFLILEARDSQGQIDFGRLAPLDTIVGNLRQLVGDAHPDVEAISLLCPNANLRTKKLLAVPPMFVRSWGLLQEHGKKVLPAEVARRAKARTSGATYLNWAVDQQSKAAVTRSVSRQIKSIASNTNLKTMGGLERCFPGVARVAQQIMPQSRIKSLLATAPKKAPKRPARRATR